MYILEGGLIETVYGRPDDTPWNPSIITAFHLAPMMLVQAIPFNLLHSMRPLHIILEFIIEFICCNLEKCIDSIDIGIDNEQKENKTNAIDSLLYKHETKKRGSWFPIINFETGGH